MMSPDLQRIQHIRDYCDEIRKTIQRYGADFAVFDQDADYQRSISFCILQIGELSGGLSEEYRKVTSSRVQWGPMKGMRNLDTAAHFCFGSLRQWNRHQGHHRPQSLVYPADLHRSVVFLPPAHGGRQTALLHGSRLFLSLWNRFFPQQLYLPKRHRRRRRCPVGCRCRRYGSWRDGRRH